MELTGLYKSKRAMHYLEHHGGVGIRRESYGFFCFWENGQCGYYSGSDLNYLPFFRQDMIALRGFSNRADSDAFRIEIKSEDNSSRYYFDLEIQTMESLYICGTDESSKKIAHGEVFTFVNLDYDDLRASLASTRGNKIPLFQDDLVSTQGLLFVEDNLRALSASGDWIRVIVNELSQNPRTGWLRRSDIKFWSEP